MARTSRCECGQLNVTVDGGPSLYVLCACRDCQRRSGSAFYGAAWFEKTAVTSIEGRSSVYRRASDFDREVERHFCPDCGGTVYAYASVFPDRINVNAAGFEGNDLEPQAAVFMRSLPSWVTLSDQLRRHETQPF